LSSATTSIFASGNTWDLYAPKGVRHSLRDALEGQMQYSYFPVQLDELGAEIRYHELVEGTFRIADVTIRTRYLNHPALTFGYRLETEDAAVVYASDHEPHSRHLAGGSGEIGGEDLQHCQFLGGADLVIHDAQYTADEYPQKIGWGKPQLIGRVQQMMNVADPALDDITVIDGEVSYVVADYNMKVNAGYQHTIGKTEGPGDDFKGHLVHIGAQIQH
jgi:hypothetical protein